MPNMTQRRGIASGGNWIVDRVKTVDCLPGRGMLANILTEKMATGGAPANVLADLARLQAPFPLSGVGVIGKDPDGDLILRTFRDLGVDMERIVVAEDVPTSYTDVMTEQARGERTFFHCRGANARFGPEHIPVKALTCKIFHLGYILLLDRMDQPDETYGTVAARALHMVRQQGIRTSVDVVSEESDRFSVLVPPALKYVDYLIVNEIEAGRATRRKVRSPDGKLDAAALVDVVDELHTMGAMELVAVHMPEGVYMKGRSGKPLSSGSLTLPQGFIQSTLGAGDAFCAGMLYGIHEGWDFGRAAHLGSCCAAACLSALGASDGVKPLAEVLELGRVYPEGPPPVRV